MNVMKYDMFPTLVVGFTDFITNDQRNDIIDYLSNEEFVGHKTLLSNKGKSTFHTDQKLLESLENISSCKDLKSKIGKMINDYALTSGFSFSEIQNSWANVQYPESVLDEHAHPLSSISGALYLNVDELSSSLYFQNPNPYLDYTKITEHTQYSYHWTEIKPQNGLLLLFPSWLKHGSNGQMNQTEKRIVLSFNAI
jgi:uncharacterized protein (TIGR02466 family)